MKRNTRRGSVITGLFLLVLGGFWTFMALQDVWGDISSRSPVEMTLAEYVKERPSGNWLKLTECQVNLIECIYEEDTNGRIKRLYVPIHPPGEVVPAYVVIKNTSYNAKMQELMDNQNDPEKLEALLTKYGDMLTEVREFEGWVSSSSHSDVTEKFTSADVTSDFIVLEDGAKGDMARSIFMLAIGLLTMFGGLKSLLKK
jgi:hypothetical protein